MNAAALAGLVDWVDFDRAHLVIGRALGLFEQEVTSVIDIKPILWSKNPVSDCLHEIVQQLVTLGLVLHDEETDKFKLNPHFEAWAYAKGER